MEIKNINIPFFTLVGIMIKWMLAWVVANVVLLGMLASAVFIVGMFLGIVGAVGLQ